MQRVHHNIVIVELAVLNDLHQTGAGFRKDRMVCFETIHQHGELAFPQRQGSSCDDDTLTIAVASLARHLQRWFHANDRNVVFVAQLVGCGGSGGIASDDNRFHSLLHETFHNGVGQFAYLFR